MKLNMKNKKKGQGMTEYLIIVALIAVTAIGITTITSNHIKVGFGRIAKALQGQQDAGRYEQVTDDLMNNKDMGEFTDNVNKGR